MNTRTVDTELGNRIAGFDYLRVFALLLVFVQHQLSVLGREDLASLRGCSIGQVGVSIFLIISGALAARGNAPPYNWFWKRIIRIYPAYWIVTCVAFLGAATSGYKSFSVTQVISQLAATGLFTHRGQLVNVASWFVSLLLLLYFVTFAIRYFSNRDKHRALAGGALVILCCVMVVMGIEHLLSAHALSFFTGFTLLSVRQFFSNKLLIALAACFFFLLVSDQNFAYPFVAVISVLFSLPISRTPQFVTIGARYSYEFYLSHGIILVAVQRWLPGHMIFSIFAGITISIAVSPLIQRLAQPVTVGLQHVSRSSVKPC